ncbi:MAG: 6-phosphogluconolactonase [Blastocatellia bacterium]
MQSGNHSEDENEGRIAVFSAGGLRGEVYSTREDAAAAAARGVGDHLRRLIAERGRAIGLFDSAPSQALFLERLAREPVAWTRVIALQTGEFAGLGEDAPQSRRFSLIDRLVKRVPMAEFHGMRGEAANPRAVMSNYGALLAARPADFAVLGLGRGGELGFLDSAGCDFDDPAPVRMIDLDDRLRHEQVEEGIFASLPAAPARALAVTAPVILGCARLFMIAAGAPYREAVNHLLHAEVSPARPATILRAHENVRLFLDAAAAGPGGGSVMPPGGTGWDSAS